MLRSYNSEDDIKTDTQTSNMALMVLEKANNIESKYFAGDPATAFHEIRRFLFMQGVETKLYTAASVPITAAKSLSMVGSFQSVDNAFFSEFRAMVPINSSEKWVVLNTLIFILRVFFNPTGDGNHGTVQIMLNHLHDSVFELNDMYGDMCRYMEENNWEGHRPSAELGNSSLTACMVFKHEFNSVHDFSVLFHKLRPIIDCHRMTGSNLPWDGPLDRRTIPSVTPDV